MNTAKMGQATKTLIKSFNSGVESVQGRKTHSAHQVVITASAHKIVMITNVCLQLLNVRK